jgi:predicted flap endonuclease-1-like 5' DNA nuclease
MYLDRPSAQVGTSRAFRDTKQLEAGIPAKEKSTVSRFKLEGGGNIMGRVLAVLLGLALALAGVAFLMWILWRLWKRQEEEAAPPVIEIKPKAPLPVAPPKTIETEGEKDSVPVEPETKPPTADDLKRIEGIGPKISSVLQAAGIATFAQLAAAEVSEIEQMLEEADPRLRRLADPTTWPEQAQLAAAGEWDALAALLSELKGGRRV